MASNLERVEVEKCPGNENEFRNASKRLNCTLEDNGRTRYLCLPNSNKSKLLEFCFYQRVPPLRQAGYCPQIHDTNQLNGETCENFKYGCPNTFYDMQKLYKHPACLEIDMKKQCYLADPECLYTKSSESSTTGNFSSESSTTARNNIQHTNGNTQYLSAVVIPVSITISIIIVLILAGIIILILWRKRRRKGTGDLENGNGNIQDPTETSRLTGGVGTNGSPQDIDTHGSSPDVVMHVSLPDDSRHDSPSDNGAVTNGSPSDDVMHSSPPNDVVHGSPPNDVVHGSPPNDVVHGSPPNDVVHGSPPNDVVHGSPPNDVVHDTSPDNAISDQQTFDQPTNINTDTVIKTAINILLYKDIYEKLEQKDIEYLRDFTKGILSEEERKKPLKDFLSCFDEKIDLKKNLYYLQAILHRMGNAFLVDVCAKVAEALPITVYLERPKTPPVNGFKDVTFHFKCKGKFRKEDIKRISEQLNLLVGEPVMYREGENTNSYLLTYMISEYKIILLKGEVEKAGNKLSALGVDYFLVDEKKYEVASEEIQNMEIVCVSQINGDTVLEVSFDSPNVELQSITWQKAEGKTSVSIDTDTDKYNGASPESPSLTIKSFGQADMGMYICTVKSLSGKNLSRSISIDETFLFPQEVQLALCSLLLKNEINVLEVDFSSLRNIYFFSHFPISEEKKINQQSLRSCKDLNKYVFFEEDVLKLKSETSKTDVFLSFCRRKGFVDFILNQDVAFFEMLRSPNYKPRLNERCWNMNMQQLETMTRRMGLDILRHPTLKDKTIHDKVANILNIPKEILQWGEDGIKVFVEHIKKGETRIYHAIGMIVGCASAGKTTLLKKIKGEKDLSVESTRGVDTINDFEIEGTDIKGISRRDTNRCIKVRQSELHGQNYQLKEKRKEKKHKITRTKTKPDNEKQNETKTGGQFKGQSTSKFTNDISSEESRITKPEMKLTSQEDLPNFTNDISSEESRITKPEDTDLENPKKESSGKDRNITTSTMFKDKEASKKEVYTDESKLFSHDPKIKDDFMPYVSLYTNRDMKTISFLDFAGQCTYYASHQVYLSPRSFYILVVNMSKSLDEKVGEEECDFPGSYYDDWTYKDFIIYWMESIHAYSDTDSFSDSANMSCPVILVLTHSDKIKREADIEEETRRYFNAIMEVLPDNVKKHLDISRVFATSKESNHNIQELKKCVVNLVQKLEHWGRSVPIAWSAIESKLQDLKPLKICKTEMVWKEICSNTFVDELKSMEDMKIPLKFFHETGKILHFSEPLLEEWIILDIQWFVDSFKNIITIKSHAEKDLPCHALQCWFAFRENGVLTDELLTEIWENIKEDYISYKGKILLYMKKMGFITELESISEEGGKGAFYVPCMNTRKVSRDLLPVGVSSSVLGFRFEFLPSGLYHRLVAACINNLSWDIWMPQGKRCLFDKVSIFKHKKLESHKIYIGLNEIKSMQRARKLHQYAVDVQVVAEGSHIDNRVCREVRRTLMDELKSTAKIFHANIPFGIIYGFRQTESPKDIPVTHYVELNNDNMEKFHQLASIWEEEKEEDKASTYIGEIHIYHEEKFVIGDGSTSTIGVISEAANKKKKKSKRKKERQEDSDNSSSCSSDTPLMEEPPKPVTNLERELTNLDMLARKSKYRLKVLDVPGDGHSLYHAFCKSNDMHGRPVNPKELRRQLVKFLESSPNTPNGHPYKDLLCLPLDQARGVLEPEDMAIEKVQNEEEQKELRWQRFLKKIQDGEWGGSLEILGLAQMYNVPVTVLSVGQNGLRLNEFPFNHTSETLLNPVIFIGHLKIRGKGVHFVALKPLQGKAVEQPTSMQHDEQHRKAIDGSYPYKDKKVIFDHELGKRIGCIELNTKKRRYGTGFRVGSKYVMTAFHVMEEVLVPFWHNVHKRLNDEERQSMRWTSENLPVDGSWNLSFLISLLNPSKQTTLIRIAKEMVTNSSLIKFGYMDGKSDMKSILKFSFDVAFASPQHDIVILKLSEEENLPPPLLLKDTNIPGVKHHVIDNLKGTDLQHDSGCIISENNTVKNSIRFFTSRGSNINQVEEGYAPCVLSPDHSLYHCSESTTHGASGSPLIVIEEKPQVIGMLLRGHPHLCYNYVNYEDHPELLMESGISMEKVKSLLKEHSLHQLARELFSQNL